MSKSKHFLRGSEWRIWDFHVHTPASFHWNGQRLTSSKLDTPQDIQVIDEMINALNNAEADVFVLMDYFTFDGWFALQNRLQMPDAPQLKKMVFPGIELRISAPVSYRMNAHLILNNNLSNDELNGLRRSLKIEGEKDDLSDDNIVKYAKNLLNDRLNQFQTGLTQDMVSSDDELAKKVGYGTIKVTEDSYINSVNKVGIDNCIIMMPWDTNDGLKETDWIEHNGFVRKLMKYSKVFETRKQLFIDVFNLIETEENKNFIENFRGSLGNEPALAVSGSDAHRYKSSGEERGYADFPSNKKTWIKADTTFEGLLQAIREPANRSFIGSKPPKVEMVERNPEYFIDSVTIDNNTNPISWFKPETYPLNKDLVAIIGNKGSGKSALIDCIAHVISNKTDYEHDNFVKKFQKINAKENIQFKIAFENNCYVKGSHLTENTNSSNVITYLPQGYFEDLCNKSTSKEFQTIINDIIFSYIDENKRLSKDNYDDLINLHDSTINNQMTQIKSEISYLNERYTKNIDVLSTNEEELNQSLTSLNFRKSEIEDTIQKESQQLAQFKQDNQLLAEVNQLQQNIKEIEIKLETNRNAYKSAVIRRDLLSKAIEELEFIKNKHSRDIQDIANKYLGNTDIEIQDVCSLTINFDIINSKVYEFNLEIQQIMEVSTSLHKELEEYKSNLEIKNQQLSLSNQTIHGINENIVNAKSNLEVNNNKIGELTKQKETIEQAKTEQQTLVNQRKEKLKALLQKGNEKVQHRVQMFDGINKQINDLITYDKIDISLNFQVMFYFDYEAFQENLKNFIYMRKNFLNATNIIETIDECFSDNSSIERFNSFADNFIKKLEEESNQALDDILKDRDRLKDFYNFIYSLSYIKIRNIIQFKETDINSLSPGQRGELLIVLFLLLDKSNNPILIDQPEENLDNQTIFNTLVPIIKKAKERRQILMVTHNPNLAVVCDAEQIIYASFNRVNNNQISYELGSIENEKMKSHIVDVLEGTQPAFINRQRKYNLT